MLRSPYNKPKITPPEQHPYLMLREGDISRIRENLVHSENARAYELWQRVCNKKFTDFYEDIRNGQYNMLVCMMIEAKALKLLLSPNADEAKALIKISLETLKRYSVADNIMAARFGGHLIFVICCVYDWLYTYWTVAQREKFIALCEALFEECFETGYPPVKQNGVAGHAVEAEMFRDMLGFSMAVYHERPDIYDYVAGKIFDLYAPDIERFYESSYSNQGPAYGAYRYVFAMWCQMLFYSMSGEKIFSENVENLPDSFYYLTRGDGEHFRLGDDCDDDKGGGFTAKNPFVIAHFFGAAATGNEHYRKAYFDNFVDEYMLPSVHNIGYYKYGCYGEGCYSPTVHLIWHRLTEPQEAAAYPKARFFGYPNGITVYKDGDTSVYMKVGELHGTGHDHFDAGDFQIYHSGSLISSSGVYSAYGDDHFNNYLIRTVAHNCITIKAPDAPAEIKYCKLDNPKDAENFIEMTALNDGGILLPNHGRAERGKKQFDEIFRMAHMVSHTETDDLIELVGDLTHSYRDRCDKVIRKMKFEPRRGACGVFTLEDEIVCKRENCEVQLHLHTLSAPKIEGDKITIVHEGGRLVCMVADAQSVHFELIGGEGRQFVTNGINFDLPEEKKQNRECGWGRVTLTSKAKGKTHKFLLEMELFDAEL